MSRSAGIRSTVSPFWGTNNWWLLLLTGVSWLIVSIVIFRFDYTMMTAVGVLFGIIALGSAANELLVSMVSTPGWRIPHLILAVLLAVVGVVLFVHPGNTFEALAALVSFYLPWVVRPHHRVLTQRHAGLVAATVGATTLMRGITEIVGAFQLRELNRAARGERV